MGCNCGGGGSYSRTAAAERARNSPIRTAGCGADEDLYDGPNATKKVWIVGDTLYRQDRLTAATAAARQQRVTLRTAWASQFCQSAIDALYPV